MKNISNKKVFIMGGILIVTVLIIALFAVLGKVNKTKLEKENKSKVEATIQRISDLYEEYAQMKPDISVHLVKYQEFINEFDYLNSSEEYMVEAKELFQEKSESMRVLIENALVSEIAALTIDDIENVTDIEKIEDINKNIEGLEDLKKILDGSDFSVETENIENLIISYEGKVKELEEIKLGEEKVKLIEETKNNLLTLINGNIVADISGVPKEELSTKIDILKDLQTQVNQALTDGTLDETAKNDLDTVINKTITDYTLRIEEIKIAEAETTTTQKKTEKKTSPTLAEEPTPAATTEAQTTTSFWQQDFPEGFVPQTTTAHVHVTSWALDRYLPNGRPDYENWGSQYCCPYCPPSEATLTKAEEIVMNDFMTNFSHLLNGLDIMTYEDYVKDSVIEGCYIFDGEGNLDSYETLLNLHLTEIYGGKSRDDLFIRINLFNPGYSYYWPYVSVLTKDGTWYHYIANCGSTWEFYLTHTNTSGDFIKSYE